MFPTAKRLLSQPSPARFRARSASIAQAGGTSFTDHRPRRIVLILDDDPAMRGWSRLACGSMAGRDWVIVRYQAGRGLRTLAQSLDSLLKQSEGRWPLVVGCGGGAVVALRAALDHGEAVGGLLLVGAVSAASHPASSPSRMSGRDGAMGQWLTGMGELWSRWRGGDAARRLALSGELAELAPQVRAIHAPIVLVDSSPMATFLEGCLTGCRMLTTVTVPGGMPTPHRHESEVRGALDALVSAVERAGR